jgi:uncharacterized protein
MSLRPLPAVAAWRHLGAREGFEVAFLGSGAGDGHRLEGHVAAVEEGAAWVVEYVIVVDAAWRTREARVRGRSAAGRRDVVLEAVEPGRWRIDGARAPHLDGCLDVDLEASALTNTIPVHRLALAVGTAAEAPAAYVRAVGLAVERLDQRYARADDDGRGERYGYEAPRFGFAGRLSYDAAGLVLDYPGLAQREV